MNISLPYCITLTAFQWKETRRIQQNYSCVILCSGTSRFWEVLPMDKQLTLFCSVDRIPSCINRWLSGQPLVQQGPSLSSHILSTGRRSLTKMLLFQDWYYLLHWTDDCKLDIRPEILCRYNTHCAVFRKKIMGAVIRSLHRGTSASPLAPRCMKLVSGYLPSPPYLQGQGETLTKTVLGIFLFAVHIFKMINNEKNFPLHHRRAPRIFNLMVERGRELMTLWVCIIYVGS